MTEPVMTETVRALARRLRLERRSRLNALSRGIDANHFRKALLQRLGTAVGVHVGSPVVTRYDEYADRIVALALRMRADEADCRVNHRDPPRYLAAFERNYVEALNAVLAAPGDSPDVDRWRGHAEARRQTCEEIRRQRGLPAVAYTSAEWRAANGVYPQDYLDQIHGKAKRP
jgi:hypothetical protein